MKNEIKKLDSYKTNNNYKSLENNIKSNKKKVQNSSILIKKRVPTIELIRDSYTIISHSLTLPSLPSLPHNFNKNEINTFLSELNSIAPTIKNRSIANNIKIIKDNCNVLLNILREESTINNKKENLIKKTKNLISYKIPSEQNKKDLDYYILIKSLLENKQKYFTDSLKKYNTKRNNNNKNELFKSFFKDNIALAQIIDKNIDVIKFKNSNNKLYYYYDNDNNLFNLFKLLIDINNNIQNTGIINQNNIDNLKLQTKGYLSNTNSKNSNINKNIFMTNLLNIFSKENNNNIVDFNNYIKDEYNDINKLLKILTNIDTNYKSLNSTFYNKINILIENIIKINNKVIHDNSNKKNKNENIKKSLKSNNKNIIVMYPYSNTLKLYLMIFYTIIIILLNFK